MAPKNSPRKATAKAAKPDPRTVGAPFDPRDGKALAAARDAGRTWPDILAATGAKSAIPLRVVLRRYLAANPAASEREAAKVAKLPATPKAVVEARDGRGEGFPLIAARTGVSVAKVRELYALGGGLSADGRVYVGSAGRTLVRRPGESEAIPAKPAKRTRKAKAAAAPKSGSPAAKSAARKRAKAATRRAA